MIERAQNLLKYRRQSSVFFQYSSSSSSKPLGSYSIVASFNLYLLSILGFFGKGNDEKSCISAGITIESW
uniref:Uncharacterized protein n=1 Tax=Salix viminalis TaxID=40686 RepID=A0A6N2LWD4_SALVM